MSEPLRPWFTRALPRAAHRAPSSRLRAVVLAAMVPVVASPALAQTQTQTQTPPAPVAGTRPPAQLPPVVVTASPLGSDLLELAAPASVLEGERLLERRAPTLGATLEGEPGVASSGFAPGAARPVIRGLDGERVRILSNGV